MLQGQPCTSNNSNASNCDRADEGSSESINRGSSDAVPGTTASEWINEEQLKLEEAMARFSADKFTTGERYMHVAAQLPNRTARDVALRLKWLSLQSNSKRAKPPRTDSTPVLLIPPPASAHSNPQRIDSKPAPLPRRPPLPSALSSLLLAPLKDEPSGGSEPSGTGNTTTLDLDTCTPSLLHSPGLLPVPSIPSLLDANSALLDPLRSNLQACRLAENRQLLLSFRDNLLSILDQLSAVNPEAEGGLTSGQMPQLPVQLNLELANSFLHPPAASPSHAAQRALGSEGVFASAFVPSSALQMLSHVPAPLPYPTLGPHAPMAPSAGMQQLPHNFIPTGAASGGLPLGPAPAPPQAMTMMHMHPMAMMMMMPFGFMPSGPPGGGGHTTMMMDGPMISPLAGPALLFAGSGDTGVLGDSMQLGEVSELLLQQQEQQQQGVLDAPGGGSNQSTRSAWNNNASQHPRVLDDN